MDPTHAALRMHHIAARLGELYAEQSQAALGLRRNQQALANRTTQLAPPCGWPGRGAEQRRLAQARALAADRIARQLAGHIDRGHARLYRLSAAIARLEAERRALEWGVCADLAHGLSSGRPGPRPAAIRLRPAGEA